MVGILSATRGSQSPVSPAPDAAAAVAAPLPAELSEASKEHEEEAPPERKAATEVEKELVESTPCPTTAWHPVHTLGAVRLQGRFTVSTGGLFYGKALGASAAAKTREARSCVPEYEAAKRALEALELCSSAERAATWAALEAAWAAAMAVAGGDKA